MPESTSALASFTFPRTGKRGVPQQFPRRLYGEFGFGSFLNSSAVWGRKHCIVVPLYLPYYGLNLHSFIASL